MKSRLEGSEGLEERQSLWTGADRSGRGRELGRAEQGAESWAGLNRGWERGAETLASGL